MNEAVLAATRPILGVTSSVLGRAWQARLDDAGEQRAMALAQAHGLPDLLARVLAARSIGVDNVGCLFSAPKLRDLLSDPSTLVDMDKAVARLARGRDGGASMSRSSAITMSTAPARSALFASYLRDLGCEISFHIPDRLTEGYGPNVEAVTALAAGRREPARDARLRHDEPCASR